MEGGLVCVLIRFTAGIGQTPDQVRGDRLCRGQDELWVVMTACVGQTLGVWVDVVLITVTACRDSDINYVCY